MQAVIPGDVLRSPEIMQVLSVWRRQATQENPAPPRHSGDCRQMQPPVCGNNQWPMLVLPEPQAILTVGNVWSLSGSLFIVLLDSKQLCALIVHH